MNTRVDWLWRIIAQARCQFPEDSSQVTFQTRRVEVGLMRSSVLRRRYARPMKRNVVRPPRPSSPLMHSGIVSVSRGVPSHETSIRHHYRARRPPGRCC